MKSISDLILLGDPRLYLKCEPVLEQDLAELKNWVQDLHQVMEDIKRTYNFGRAIAAPQLGIMKQLIYMNIDRPIIIINPELVPHGNEKIVLWDDCMSFPMLLVKLERHKEVEIKYKDENWQDHKWLLKDDLSELMQHEFDHLNGVLCTMRAIDNQSFKWRVLA